MMSIFLSHKFTNFFRTEPKMRKREGGVRSVCAPSERQIIHGYGHNRIKDLKIPDRHKPKSVQTKYLDGPESCLSNKVIRHIAAW